MSKQINLCLVHTPCLELRDDRLEPPLGLLYLASVVERAGYQVCLVDLASVSLENIPNHLPNGFDVYGFSTFSVNYQLTCRIKNLIKESNPKAFIIAGGPHATALPNQVVEDGFDTVITAEGEYSLLECMQLISQGKKPAKIIAGKPYDNLDELPYPNFNDVDINSYSREVGGEKCLSLITSRGCPYPCAFCNSNIMGAGKPIRYRSPEHIVGEIKNIKQRYGIKHFRMQDDMFTINIKRIKQLTPHLAELDIFYRCFARVNSMSSQMASLLKESGCLHASFGVESGSPKILAKGAMEKHQTPKQIREGLTNAYNAGIKSRIYLMVGFPGETDETIAETLDLVKDCPWDEFAVYPVIAYPGTPLHDRPDDFGITYIDKNYNDYLQIGKNFKAGFTIRTKTFDEHKVKYWRDYMIQELLSQNRIWAGNSNGFI